MSTMPKNRQHALDLLFDPECIAIIGLSRRAINAPVSVLSTLREYGYRGDIFVINPNMGGMEAEDIYTGLHRVRKTADVAIITLPRDAVLPALRECVDNGIRAAIIITQGFADADQEGKELQGRIAALAGSSDMSVVGPNTIGIANGFSRFTSSFIEIASGTEPVGVVSQSGLFMMGHHLINDETSSFGMAVDLGNACDLNLLDVLEYYERQERIKVIQCHVEGIDDGPRFLDLASRVGKHKPIALLKPGRSGAGKEMVASHSGAAAGENEVYDAAFRKAGVLVADSVEELQLLSKALSFYRPPRGKRVAVMSFSGGAAILAVDALARAGLVLAELSPATLREVGDLVPEYVDVKNPLDIWLAVSSSFHQTYPRILELVLRDPGVDAVLCVYASLTLPKYDAYDTSIHITTLAREYPDIPIACWSYGLDVSAMTRRIESERNVVVFPSLGSAAGILAKMADYAIFRNRPEDGRKLAHEAPAGPGRGEADAILAAASDQGRILQSEAFSVLEAYGVEVATFRIARNESELDALSTALPYPVCIKVESEDIVHKSDSGGVILGINGPAELMQAHRELRDRLARSHPGASIDGVLIQQMMAEGREVIIGAKRDPVFGPCVLFGAGGIFTEVLDDFAFRLPPLDADEAGAMIDEIAYAGILRGARGQAPCNRTALIGTLLNVSRLVCDHPEIRELDINPLIVNAERAIAVDARIVL